MPHLCTIRPQLQILVLLEVNLGLKGFKYELSCYLGSILISLKGSRFTRGVLDLLRVNFWSFCNLNYKFSSNLRSISRQFRLIQSRIFKDANGKNTIYLQSPSTTTKILDANKVSLVKLYRLLTIE